MKTIGFPRIARGFLLLSVLLLDVANTSAQVPESELSSLERNAAMNRESAIRPSSQEKPGIDFFTLMIKGGFFMIPIGVVSLVVVTMVFDRLIGLRSGRLIPRHIRKGLLQLTRQGDLQPKEIFDICGNSKSSLANILRTTALSAGRPMNDIQAVAQEAAQLEADRAYSNVRWLNLAAGVAPLLGLLGTVWGLIRAFHDTTQLTAGQNRADYLAVGIYEALVTTLAGLMVAIPAAVASHYFEGRVTKMFGNIQQIIMTLLPRLEHLEGKTRFELIGRELVSRDIRTVNSPSFTTPPPAAASTALPAGIRPAPRPATSVRTDPTPARSDATRTETRPRPKP